MEVHLFTLFSRLAQADNWTKTKDFHLSCNITFLNHLQDKLMPSTKCRAHVHIQVHTNIKDFKSKAEVLSKIIKVGFI